MVANTATIVSFVTYVLMMIVENSIVTNALTLPTIQP